MKHTAHRATVLLTLLALTLALSLLSALAVNQTASISSAPVAENLTLRTYRNTTVSGQLSAVDPDGDPLTYQLTSQPARGSVTLTEAGDGTFCYTPYETKTGKDSFTYVAVDAAGNISSPATVKVTIAKAKTTVSYVDLNGNPAGYAALRLAERGAFVGQCIDGCYYFEPEDPVSRGEFLAMAMCACGYDSLSGVETTGFADDSELDAWVKGYAAAALQSGYIQGIRTEGGSLAFAADLPVTADQAAVMVNNLLSLSDVSAQAFACDTQSVSAWAVQSVVNLSSCGVPCMGGEQTLTRAQAAQMLSGAVDVLEAR